MSGTDGRPAHLGATVCAVPIGPDSVTRSPSPASTATSAGTAVGAGSPRYRLIEATNRALCGADVKGWVIFPTLPFATDHPARCRRCGQLTGTGG